VLSYTDGQRVKAMPLKVRLDGKKGMHWTTYIRAEPKIACGKPIVAGTRLSVEFLLGLLAEGWSFDQILENYPGLTPESLRAVFAFAAETLGDEVMYPALRAG
jgi:uncharacterized protein (DUF433 family)